MTWSDLAVYSVSWMDDRKDSLSSLAHCNADSAITYAGFGAFECTIHLQKVATNLSLYLLPGSLHTRRHLITSGVLQTIG